jgi:hypothetical protein
MELSDQDIIKFQSLYKKLFGKEISRENAFLKGSQVLKFVSLVCKQNKSKENNEKHTKTVQ